MSPQQYLSDNLTRDFFDRSPINLPWLRPAETLYSWFANVHRLNFYRTALRTSHRLFNFPYAALAHDIPSRLSSLRRLGITDLASPRDLAVRHSLAGFYFPFLRPDTCERLERHIDVGEPKDVKYHLGLPASRVGALHPLKSCENCIESDVKRFGHSYWHTEHQSPASWICLSHRELLRVHHTARSPRHLRTWVLPDDDAASTVETFGSEFGKSLEPLRRLAEFAELAKALPPSSLSAHGLAGAYWTALRQKGLLTQANRLRMRKIVQLTASFYSDHRHLPGFQVVDTTSNEWAGFLGTALRRGSRQTHPFKHLLLIAMLFERWDDFLEAYREGEQAAASEETTPSRKDKGDPDPRQAPFFDLVERQGLSLRAASAQVGITATTAVRWAKVLGLRYTRRPKYLTDAVLDKCRSMLKRGSDKSLVAQKANVSMTSVTRLLSSEPELRKAWLSAKFHQDRRKNRERFKKLLNENPGVPLRLLRKIPGNGYMWLYRHDRDWLMENLPTVH